MSKEKEYFEWTGEVLTIQDIRNEQQAELEKRLTIDPDIPKLTKILLKIQAMRKDVKFQSLPNISVSDSEHNK